MYVYVGAPHSEVIGFSNINDLRMITAKEGLQILAKVGLTRNELASYFSGYDKIGCYAVSPPALFKQPLSLEALRSRSGFSPPQSFVALSRRASEWLALRELGQWPRGTREHQAIWKVKGRSQ
jgi:predicted transcriptional regulator